jgi:hypothetical protein
MNHRGLGDLNLINITQKKQNKTKYLASYIDVSPMPFNAQSHLLPPRSFAHTLQIVIWGNKLILKKIGIYENTFN